MEELPSSLPLPKAESGITLLDTLHQIGTTQELLEALNNLQHFVVAHISKTGNVPTHYYAMFAIVECLRENLRSILRT